MTTWTLIWTEIVPSVARSDVVMGLLPHTSNCGCACAANAGNVFPATTCKQSRHASRHVRDARDVMHAGIANSRFPLNLAAGENVPGIPGACATHKFTYLVRGPWRLGRSHVRVTQLPETCSTSRWFYPHLVLCYVLLQSGTTCSSGLLHWDWW